jgi:hypothetical protein
VLGTEHLQTLTPMVYLAAALRGEGDAAGARSIEE